MKLRRLHPDTSLTLSSLTYWRKRTTDEIIKSLTPGVPAALKLKQDCTIMDGNTRIKVLEERGVDVNALPFEPYP